MQMISQLSESNEMKKGRRQKEKSKNILESKKGKPFAKKQKRTEKIG